MEERPPTNIEFAEALKARTKKFAVAVIRMCEKLPNSVESRHIKGQLIRCSTSVAANYRAVCRARSEAEFFSKLSIVIEEADESILWMEILTETGIDKTGACVPLIAEVTGILSVLAKSRKTISDRRKTDSK